jgi:hypothetical protein
MPSWGRASGDCFANVAFGGADAFTTDGHFAHALVILDGKCAKTSASLPDLKYRLVRVLGQVFGLGWSQLNLNAVTNSPRPTADDLAGLPAMHAQDLPSCVPISACYPNPDQPRQTFYVVQVASSATAGLRWRADHTHGRRIPEGASACH